MRCASECGAPIASIPDEIGDWWDRNCVIGDAERNLLRCARCGRPARPHVLWFDECYDEEHFHFESSLEAALTASLLLVIGTSGATNLPTQMCLIAAERRVPMVVIDPEPTPFGTLAVRSGMGIEVREAASTAVPRICADVVRALSGRP